jgi:importin-9
VNPVTGQTSLPRIFSIISKLIEPSHGEGAGMYIGDLVVQLLRKNIQSVLPILEDLLKAFVIRLAEAETASFIQVRSLAIEISK